MVNIFTLLKPLMHGLMKLAGMKPQLVEIEPGTVINFWVPNETITTTQNHNKPTKPAVVLVHGFAADGIITWLFQVLSLTDKYTVYVPDLIFFGGSITNKPERSTTFQAECLAKGLRKLGLQSCILVGFSYGGMVGFKVAELYPDLVESMVVSGAVIDFTESVSRALLANIGFLRLSDFLLPETLEGVKVLLSIGTHKPPWLPNFVFRHFLEAMFSNRKERAELLEALVVSDKEATAYNCPQRIHLLWGDDDKIFNLEVAYKMKEQLGDISTLEYIEKAGHLAMLERPSIYTSSLNKILESFTADRHKE